MDRITRDHDHKLVDFLYGTLWNRPVAEGQLLILPGFSHPDCPELSEVRVRVADLTIVGGSDALITCNSCIRVSTFNVYNFEHLTKEQLRMNAAKVLQDASLDREGIIKAISKLLALPQAPTPL
eukprot:tig00021339_g20389.t1